MGKWKQGRHGGNEKRKTGCLMTTSESRFYRLESPEWKWDVWIREDGQLIKLWGNASPRRLKPFRLCSDIDFTYRRHLLHSRPAAENPLRYVRKRKYMEYTRKNDRRRWNFIQVCLSPTVGFSSCTLHFYTTLKWYLSSYVVFISCINLQPSHWLYFCQQSLSDCTVA